MSKPKRKREEKRPAPVEPKSRVWVPIAVGFAALVALLIAYAPALNGPFVFDDPYLPFNSPEMAQAPLMRWITTVRPFLMFTFWLNLRSSGVQPYSYHLVNVLLHFVTGVFAFLIVRKLLERVGESGFSRDGLAAFAGLLFLFHPLQTESVAYIASRSEVLSVMFFYAALAVFLHRPKPVIGWGTTLGVLALFGAAALTKEHTAVLPALLLLTDYYFNPGFSFQGIKRNWRLYGLILAGGAVAMAWIWRILNAADTAGFSFKQFTWYQYFFTQCRAIWLYVRLAVLPFGQNIDHDFRISRTIFEHGAIVGLAALVALAAVAFLYRRRYPLASYGVFVFLLLLAPTSSVVPILDPTAEHRLYLPFLGLLLVAVELLRRWKAPRGRIVAALAGVLVICAALTYDRSKVWASDIVLWRDAVAKSPEKSRPHFQLGYAYFLLGGCPAALAEYETAARYEKPEYRLLVDWAMVLDCVGRNADAVTKLREAAQLKNTAHAWSLIGWELGKLRLDDQALAALADAERLDPAFEMTYVYRGDIYAKRNELPSALIEYRRALALNPSNGYAQQGIAAVSQKLNANRP